MAKRIIPQAIIVLLMLWALSTRHPYSFYTLLRFATCGIFVYLTVLAAGADKKGWAWTFGVTAFLYNPFIPIHLARDTWEAVNFATIGLAIASIFVLRKAK